MGELPEFDPTFDKTSSLEGRRAVEVRDPKNPGHNITDIDHVEGGILWEEKTATWAADTPKWIQKQIYEKFAKILSARKNLPGYENAPIGFRWTDKRVADPAFKKAVENAINDLRKANPGVDIRFDW